MCQQKPLSLSYNFITFTSNLAITPGGEIDLFTMRGPSLSSTRLHFTLTVEDVYAPSDVVMATRAFFNMRHPAPNQAVISLVRSIEGPQEIELELSMKLVNSQGLGGSAIAKLYIYVSPYTF